MSSRSTTLVGLVVSILIIGAVASIGYYQFVVAPGSVTTSTTTTPTQASCTPATCVHVTMVEGASSGGTGYSPDTITVVLGHNATVIWTNNDTAPHTVTERSGPPKSIASGNMAPGAVFQFTFDTAGTYTYGCDYHANMHGTVIVKS